MTEDKDRDLDPESEPEDNAPAASETEAVEAKAAKKKGKREPKAPPPERQPRVLPHDPRAREALGEERALLQTLGLPGFLAGLLVLVFGIGWAVLMHAILKPGPIACIGVGVLLLAYGIWQGLLPLAQQLHGRGSLVVLVAMGLTLALLLLLVGLNALSLTRHVRIDMTKNRFYSLSAESKNILKRLDKDITVTLVVASNQLQYAQYNLDDLKALLREYELNSRHIKWELVDVFRNPKRQEELGVTFGGKAIVKCEGRKEEVSLSQDNEEGLTTALYRVSKPDKDIVYYLTGHGEMRPDENGTGEEAASQFRKALDNLQIDPKELVLSRGVGPTAVPPVTVEGGQTPPKQAADNVPPDAKAVIILGPQAPVSPKEMGALESYAAQPGSAMLIALSYKPGAPDLHELLAQFKVGVKPGVVIDRYQSLDGAVVPQFDRPQGHPMLERVSLVYLPFCRAFSVEQSSPQPNPYGGPPQQPQQDAKPLLQTSDGAWLETVDLKPGARLSAQGKERGPLTAAVVVDTKKQKPPTQPGMPPPPEEPTAAGSRLVVLGSCYMLSDEYLKLLPMTSGGNITFASQAMTWLTGGQPISIPAKKPYTFTVSFGRGAQILICALVVFLIPLGTVAFGIVVWWRRR